MVGSLITGAAGLIGSEAALHFGGLGLDVVGIDNDMRQVFFGAEGSTEWLTLASDNGNSLDQTFPVGTPKGDLTFS